MRVLIVDDHPLFRKGVEVLLRELDPQVQATGVGSVELAVGVAGAEKVDLVLLDMHLPNMAELEALSRMREALPSVPVVVVSAKDEPAFIWEAIKLGAAGYIPKDTEQALMIQALELVLARGVYLPPHALRSEAAATGHKHECAAATLSARQLTVLQGILQGKSNKVIARDLGIAEGTVKAHLSAIYEVLGVGSRLQAMSKAHELGLVERFTRLM